MIIFFSGDFFCAENDDFSFEDLSKNIGINNKCILNFEGSVSISNKIKIKRKINLIQKRTILDNLSKNIYLNLVNNHSTDLGIKNYFEMKKEVNNINNLNNVKDRNLISIENTKILFLADKREDCNLKDTYFLGFDFKNILDISDKVKDSIVIIHGGLEGRIDPTPYQRYLSHLLVDLSAKAVIFVHSHVEGTTEIYKNKLIHYGLGNFYFSKIGKFHGHKKDQSILLGFDTRNKQISTYKYEQSSSLIKYDYKITEYPPLCEYRSFYEKKYKITSSLRPRQLEYTQLIVNAKFYLWNFFAKIIVRIGISKVIKSLFLIYFRILFKK